MQKILRMKMFKVLSFLILFCWVGNTGFCTDYYVSNSGNDNNHGTSVKKPFKTIHKINSLELKPGDRIFFKRNEKFSGELLLNFSGTMENPIVITSYGEGTKPVFTGAVAINEFSDKGNDIYSASLKTPVKQLYINHEYQTPCRYPDEDYLFIDRDSENNQELVDGDLRSISNDVLGAVIRIQTVNWQWELRKISEIIDDKVILDSALWHPCRKNFGYYLENKPQFCTRPGEWYYDVDEDKLKLKLLDKQMLQNIEGVIYSNGVVINKSTSNIIISDIQFRQYDQSGIQVGEYSENIVIKNCNISETEIFGIEFKTACRNCKLENNRIEDVRGRGISMIEPEHSVISHNTVKRIGLVPGKGFDGVNNGIGIAIMNIEFRDQDYEHLAHDNLISYNRVDSTGYCGIRMDGYNSIAEFNIINDAILTMNDGGGFYCWGLNYNYTFNNIIRNNIVRRVHGSTLSAAGNYNMTYGYYIDNRCKNLIVENNIAVGVKGGINLNDGSHHISVKNNLIYGAETGILMTVFGKQYNDKLRGMHTITNNIIYLRNQEDVAIKIGNNLQIEFNPGRIDSNLYVNYCYPKIFEMNAKDADKDSRQKYTLKSWQENLGFDRHASIICPEKGDRWWEHEDFSKIIINDSPVEKTITTQEGYSFDVSLQKHMEKINLKPHTACILMHSSMLDE